MALICAASQLFAQNTISEDLLRADKQFNLYAYNLALKTYKQVLANDANNGHALARVADCYFQLNQPEESLNWYKRAVEQREPNSDVQLRYGKALMLKGDYAQARRQFLEYAALNDEAQKTGRYFADMCDYAIKTAAKDPAFIAKNEALNTTAADFGSTFLNNRVVYSSARTDIVRTSQSKSTSDWSGSAYNQLFITQRSPENGALQKPVFFRADLQNNYNEGPVSFSGDGKKVAFCRNNFVNGTRQIAEKGMNMSLYIADVVDGEWVNAQPFPFNGSDYATGFPWLSSNGTMLLFSSNNPSSTTGGKGWDIYVSNLVNNEWSTPRNLGAPLNTPGNEVTPYYDGEDFYFSSDWHNGLGGLDVFRAEIVNKEIKSIQHLGPGINSSYDDYGFVFNTQQKVGYLTSNRPGGRGNEDIWQIVKKGEGLFSQAGASASRSLASAMGGRSTTTPASDTQNPIAYSTTQDFSSTIKNYYILVSDAWGRPIPGVNIDMTNCNNGRGQTDTEGKYYFGSFERPMNCTIELDRQGYENARVDVKEFGAHNIVVSLGTDTRQEFTGTVLDASNRQPLYGAIVAFTDNGKTIQTSTDSYGKYALMLTPRTVYDIEYSNEGYKVAKVKTRPGTIANSTEIAAVLLEPAQANNSNLSAGRSFTPAANNVQPDNTVVYTPSQYNISSKPTSSTTIYSAQQAQPEPEFNGYSIQLAALPQYANDSELLKFESLAKHGNIYTKAEDNKNKIRLGIYPTKDEAQKKLKEVNKDARFKGSFIVEERGADKDLVLGGKSNAAPVQYGIASTPNAARSAGATSPTVAPVRNEEIRYAVQLGAFSNEEAISITDYAALSDLGQVYSKSRNNKTRIRLGVWPNYADAEIAQTEAVKRGFTDAIIVTEKASDEKLKGFMASEKNNTAPATSSAPKGVSRSNTTATPVVYSATSSDGAKYYVRVCALKNAGGFDADQLEAAGVDGSVEKWPVGNSGFTAIMLAGYPTLDAANKDKEKLRTGGFPDAYVMKELKGEMTRIR